MYFLVSCVGYPCSKTLSASSLVDTILCSYELTSVIVSEVLQSCSVPTRQATCTFREGA